MTKDDEDGLSSEKGAKHGPEIMHGDKPCRHLPDPDEIRRLQQEADSGRRGKDDEL